MATTRLRSKPEGLWRQAEQRHVFRGEPVVHGYPLFGQAHVVQGYPACQCWCEPKIELLEEGTLITHNRVH